MNATKVLRVAHRTPLIKFVGKHTPPHSYDHNPAPHPASPNQTLPASFKEYRSNAQQHGPLASKSSSTQSRSSSSSSSSQISRMPSSPSSPAYGAIGGHSGSSLGSVKPPKGTYFDRSELPKRFGRTPWTQAEIDAVETGGASMFG